jgi:hypothetical protein
MCSLNIYFQLGSSKYITHNWLVICDLALHLLILMGCLFFTSCRYYLAVFALIVDVSSSAYWFSAEVRKTTFRLSCIPTRNPVIPHLLHFRTCMALQADFLNLYESLMASRYRMACVTGSYDLNIWKTMR